MKNKGLHQNRFRNQPLEHVFAAKWDELNSGKCDIIGFLLSKNNSGREISPEERRNAATIIQWLGSPVGQMFIREVMKDEV